MQLIKMKNYEEVLHISVIKNRQLKNMLHLKTMKVLNILADQNRSSKRMLLEYLQLLLKQSAQGLEKQKETKLY